MTPAGTALERQQVKVVALLISEGMRAISAMPQRPEVSRANLVISVNRVGGDARAVKWPGPEQPEIEVFQAADAGPGETVSMARFIALREECDELRHHSSRLVELLHDAWWVEAGQHLGELARLVSRS